jgi:predicted transcriptional regulator
MVRTQIYLTEAEKSALSKIAARSGKKQSELIRQALDQFIASHDARRRAEVLDRAAGMWKGRDDLPDFERVRQTWDR